MEWLYSLFIEHSALQAVVVLSLISAIGLGLGKIHVCGISLGVTFVFFAGILAGHFGLSIDPQMLNYAESFGLIIFVYALGLQVGPGFFSSFRKGGVTLNMLAIAVVILGTFLTVVCSYTTGVSLPNMVGILCGATTNTPALGAAQQTLKQMGLESSTPALGCAVAYPLGVIGVILAVLFIRKLLVRREDLEVKEKDDANKTYIAAFQVHNPAIFNKSIKDIAHMSYPKFVISRLWRDGNVSIPTSEKIIKEGDRLLVVTSEKDALALTVLFGEQENTDWNKEDIDWNAIDSQLISQRIVVTRPELNGKKLGALRLRNHYGINISRVYRSGVQLLATPELTLQLGDRLTVVGEAAAIQNVEKVLGNAVKSLKEPNLVAVFVGIILGLALGAVPFSIPGISTPIRLGLAGGPIIVGILIGTFGPRLHMITYTTRSANLMLRALGLSLYLACLGLDAGAHFFDTVFRPEGLLWIGLGFGLTLVPTVLVGFFAFKIMKIDFGSVSGMLCGSMANPMALNYANDTIPGDNPSVAYATVYPLSMFLRVIIAQVLLMFLL
ncbi:MULTISPECIES: putative transporter [Bacteroides]|mgnify:FL=1|jgi:AspT/YidE/YbjL antiporter-like protein|uniref:Putative transporter n=1 Tax=Bacteroides fragilis TaxID=817 RepID=A0A413JVJ0_BACFG|nr:MULTISPECIES: putative transporter [Bacteroides]EKA81417.1 AspT/YidE/YbjL antiporter duplication domain-containing protein [Bacteroides fragilis HMW 616]MBU3039714.1 putative transporter [Bacteroides sp. HF-4919]MBY2893184.1 transporter [Bacteroides fragilis]MCE8598950.1 putative transporter [Bacteroides fragilis]MCE8633850.1 putative transporter [Bacteroides fragilis]